MADFANMDRVYVQRILKKPIPDTYSIASTISLDLWILIGQISTNTSDSYPSRERPTSISRRDSGALVK